jgi:hypothetical protein
MVMVKTDVSVLEKWRAPLEFFLDGKPVAAEEVEGLLYKVWFKPISVFMQSGHEFLKSDVPFNAQKYLQDSQSVRSPVNPFAFKKTLELPLFLIMYCVHRNNSLLQLNYNSNSTTPTACQIFFEILGESGVGSLNPWSDLAR